MKISTTTRKLIEVALVDPKYKSMTVTALAQQLNLSRSLVTMVHGDMIKQGTLPAEYIRYRGSRIGQQYTKRKGAAIKPIRVQYQIDSGMICKIRNAALLGDTNFEISMGVGQGVDQAIINAQAAFAREENRTGKMDHNREYFADGGIISRRTVIEAKPSRIAAPQQQAQPVATQSTNPFVEQVRQQHKQQMKEAFAIVMAEVKAEMLN